MRVWGSPLSTPRRTHWFPALLISGIDFSFLATSSTLAWTNQSSSSPRPLSFSSLKSSSALGPKLKLSSVSQTNSAPNLSLQYSISSAIRLPDFALHRFPQKEHWLQKVQPWSQPLLPSMMAYLLSPAIILKWYRSRFSSTKWYPGMGRESRSGMRGLGGVVTT